MFQVYYYDFSHIVTFYMGTLNMSLFHLRGPIPDFWSLLSNFLVIWKIIDYL